MHRNLRTTNVARLIILGVTFVTLLAVEATTVRADLIIQPASLMVTFDGKRPSGKFTLINTEEKEARYRARSIHFRIMANGRLDLVEPDDLSLADWVRFNPTEFELPPRGKRVVRYTILPPRDLQPGEYWGAIEFEPLEGVVQSVEDDEGRTFDITFISTALAPIFGTKGDVRSGIELEKVETGEQDGSPVLNLLVANSGLGRLHFTGNYHLSNSSGNEVEAGALAKASIVMLREGKRNIKIPLSADLVAGTYTLRLDLKVDEMDEPVRWERVIALN